MTSPSPAAVVLLLALATTTLYAQPSFVRFTNAEANHILDSLKSRGDWLRAYQIRHAQYVMAQAHIDDLDSLVRHNNKECDSVFWAAQNEQKELIWENDELRDSARRVPWIVTLATLIGLVAGLALAQ
jgi:flagellar biosynthesis protein FliP